MNRHKKFYSALDDDIEEEEYYDDYYDEEEENEYYEEDELQYIVKPGAHPPPPPPPEEQQQQQKGQEKQQQQQHISIKPDISSTNGSILKTNDIDYCLLTQLLPELNNKWNELITDKKIGIELSQNSAIEALRESEYDVEGAAIMLLKKMNENDKSFSLSTTPQPVVKPVEVTPPALVDGKTSDVVLKSGGRTLKLGQMNKNAENAKTTSVNNNLKAVEVSNSGNNNKTDGPSKSLKKNNSIQEIMPDMTKKDCTFVIAGHVDAGKSTTLGHLLLLLGKVSQADVDKNEKNAKILNKESFKYAWLLDQSEEERRRGVTIDSGSYCFETEHRRIHILDAPGHKDYVVNMISSATQADAALLVVTAATSEFEVGLAHGTRDHLLVLKTLGVGHLVVAINKMDAVDFSQERYNYVVQELGFLIKHMRYKEDAVVGFCPVSGILGTNICEIDHTATPWYDGPSLIQLLDQCPLESRLLSGALRLSLMDVDGSRLFCKVESGKLQKGAKLVFIPSDVKVLVKSIDKPTMGGLVDVAFAGDTVEIDTSSSTIGLYPGCVGCSSNALIQSSTDFLARIQTFITLQKSILPGATFTMVVHALTVQVKVIKLVSKMNRDGTWSNGMVKCVPKATQAVVLFSAPNKIALEPADVCRALGRFVLQQEGETVAGGLVEKVVV
ncbi:elongation factor 1-alpha (EF-1-alpha) [Trypanosoma theileri]|uniref:Elongation factor 1-alpha (EF-1-alpha) n=1 Tax=Trypanosoma theileri TaxID=67003 RepID=A0A1X0P591_9TRYP|nr:elongation factor 1-alpha (EF-1-alpha) [Trypanosoma theileri]ORC92045.1 elongation factor 1-alpha (EF-1-alpha) [Trypanosoma theileri]